VTIRCLVITDATVWNVTGMLYCCVTKCKIDLKIEEISVSIAFREMFTFEISG